MALIPLARGKRPGRAEAERLALADAIKAHAEAVERDAANERAKAAADDLVSAARRAVVAAEDRLQGAQRDATRGLVASLRGETDSEVAYPAVARAALEDARERLAIAEAARDELQAGRTTVIGRQGADVYLGRLRNAALGVLRVEAGPAIQSVAADLIRLQRELKEAGEAFSYLLSSGLVPMNEHNTSFPADPDLSKARERLMTPPQHWNGIETPDAALPFRKALAALMTDANAPVPEAGR